MTKVFNNENRNRYYGLRVGDIVQVNSMISTVTQATVKAEVFKFGVLDNNSVFVKEEGSEESFKVVAEWCKIIERVEDRIPPNKLYAFVVKSHYNLITKIDKDSYGIVDICTHRFTEDRFSTFYECLYWAMRTWASVKEYNTYREMFAYFLKYEQDFNILDLFKVKDIVDRQTLVDDEYVDKVRKRLLG